MAEDAQVNKNSLGPQNYSVFLSSVPPDTTEEMVREWAKVASTDKKRSPEGYPVADVNIVDDNMGLLRIYERRGRLFRALARLDYDRAQQEAVIGGRPPATCALLCDRQYARLWALQRAMAAMEAHINRLTRKAKTFRSAGATAAFVTFESTAAPAIVIGHLPPTCVTYCCQPSKYYLKNRRAQVQIAPKAEAVLWSNLNIKAGGRFLRQTVTALLALAIMLLSFVFIVFASVENSKEQKALRPADCSAPFLAQGFLNGTWTAASVAALPTSSLVFQCFCDTQIDWGRFGSAQDVGKSSFAEGCPSRSCLPSTTA